MRWILLLCLAWGVWGWSWAPAQAASDYARGRRYYRSYKYKRAVRSLRRALKRRSLPRKQKIQAHLMLAISHYNLTQSKAAARHYQAALGLERSTQIPSGQSPPAVAFFRGVRQKYLADHPKAAPAVRRPIVREPVDKPPFVRATPRRVVPPVRRSEPSLFVEPTRTPPRRVAVVKRRQAPTPKDPSARPSFWQRHRISILTGAVGIVALGVGIGLGAAFQSERAQLESTMQQPTSSGQLIYTLYQRSEGLVVPANVMLVSGGVIMAGAVGIFVAEYFMGRKSNPPKAKKE